MRAASTSSSAWLSAPSGGRSAWGLNERVVHFFYKAAAQFRVHEYLSFLVEVLSPGLSFPGSDLVSYIPIKDGNDLYGMEIC